MDNNTKMPQLKLHGVTGVHSLRYLDTKDCAIQAEEKLAMKRYEQRLKKEKRKLMLQGENGGGKSMTFAARAAVAATNITSLEETLDAFAVS